MVIIVSDISDIKVMSSTVAVIFAIVWVANNSNIWTEPNFLNRTKLIPNRIWVFQKSEPKANQG